METAKRNAPFWKPCLAIFLLTRLWVFGVTYAVYASGARELPPESHMWRGATGREHFLIEPWRRWDALWFLQVAREGYSYRPDAQSNVTVFPAYPLIMRTVGALTGSLALAGLIVSNACLLGACLALYSLTAGKAGDEAARGTLLLLLLFPSAFLLSGIYSESLFLFLCVLSLKSGLRGGWMSSGTAGALASTTRLAGIVLFPALVFERLIRKNLRFAALLRDGAPILIVPLGAAAFFLYLKTLTGSYGAYFEAQSHWGHRLASPLFSFFYTATSPLNFATLLDVGTALIFPALGVIAGRRFGWTLGLYALAAVFLPMCASNLTGLPRYVLAAFPAFMAGGWLLRRRALLVPVLVALAAMQAYCIHQFVNWRLSF
ncbi:MAG: mannosyltransferase family protein [bacterium]